MFKSNKTKFINGLYLQNSYLLEAIYHIGYFKKEKHTIKINYRDMNTEELGSVYESLLELQPQINIAAGEFLFAGEEQDVQASKTKKSKKGSERKTTASYYTHPSLVQEIIKTSLEPKIREAIKSNSKDPAKALLELRIIDPACGSGHFSG
jgi:type I restriction-modification system DNA methylase subunit